MDLYILRHGLAAERGQAGCPDDADRVLTAEGKRKLRLIARAMKAMGLSFDLILTSPYLRARQTAEVVARELRARKRPELCPALSPGGNPRKVLVRLGELAPETAAVLLVGHEPDLSMFISLLLSGDTRLPVVMKKGGLCKLTAGQLKPRCATLEWLLTPKQMALMA